MKSLNSGLVAAMLIMTMQTPAWATEAMTQEELWKVLKPYYPVYYEPRDCQGIIAEDGTSTGDSEYGKSGYCMAIDRQLTVKTADGDYLYVMTTGKLEFDKQGNQAFGAHVHAGLVGMFVFKSIDGTWRLKHAQPAINAGFFGNGLTDWKLIQVAPKLWGFINVQGDSHYGTTANQYLLLTPDLNSKNIIKNEIGAKLSFENNPYGASKCGDDSITYCTKIKGKLNIDNQTTVNGFYPLKITLNGYEYSYAENDHNKKNYNNKVYTIFYKPNLGYQEPLEYPLKNKV